LVRIPLERFRPESRIPLPAPPVALNHAPGGRLAAVTHGETGAVSFHDTGAWQMLGSVHAGEHTGAVCFRGDGKSLFAADPGRSAVLVLDPVNRALVTALRVAVRPSCFCFKPDGGELFVTGEGSDAVVIVNPYNAEVAETVLAGRGPGAMAFSRSPEYLFVTNAPSGDVTILDPETRRVVATAAVGAEPRFVTITPDDGYVLILNRRSGTMAVIRPRAVVRSRSRGAPLYTTIPVGPCPVAAAVLAV
jgi:YVTN family beta-propeller protein